MRQVMLSTSAPDASLSPSDHTEHPVVEALASVNTSVDWLHFEPGEAAGPDWCSSERALQDPDFFTHWRAALAARLAEQYDEVPARVPAGYILQWYPGVPAYIGALMFHRCRRVPALEPRQLGFRLQRAYLSGIRLQPGRFWCLPDDPARHHSDAAVIENEAALGVVLRRQVVDHAARFVRTYGPSVRFGPRTLWAAVTDALDTGLLLAGRSSGDVEAGVADARLVLSERYEPLRTASTTRALVDDRGCVHWTRQRSSCCFYYALPGVDRACATCPRVGDAERARILGELQC